MPRPDLRDPKLEQFWRTTVAKWVASGRNIRDFCRRHQLSEPSFYAWRREIAARDRTPVAKPVWVYLGDVNNPYTTRRSSRTQHQRHRLFGGVGHIRRTPVYSDHLYFAGRLVRRETGEE